MAMTNAAWLLAVGMAACSSSTTDASDGGAKACTPGATQACNCASLSGSQVCNAEGTGYGACACSDGGPGDTGPACTQNGAVACSAFLGAFCGRYVQCCNPTGSTALSDCSSKCQNLVSGSTTNYNACNQDACKAWAIRTGFDCASATFTSKTVCAAGTTSCVNDYPLIACSDLLGGTSNRPTSCKTFLAQFGLE